MAILVFRYILLSGLLLSSSLACAQPASTAGTAAPAPFQLQYLSVFTHYQSFQEQPLSSWQETNYSVGKIGGWRFYARDAQQPVTGDSADGANSDAEKKQPSGPIEKSGNHSGHGRKP